MSTQNANETIVSRGQCPECLDSGEDNLAVYEDGHAYCFGCGYHARGNKKVMSKKKTADNLRQSPLLTNGVIKALPRGISVETCKFFNYQIGTFTGYIGLGKEGRNCENEPVHIANYCNLFGDIVSQKIRTQHKEFTQLGDTKHDILFGQWLWQPSEKIFVTVVEGEIDAMSVIEVQGKQFPVVSVRKGAGGAYKDLEANLKWLMGWKHVVLAFDNDKDGHKAAEKCSTLFDPGLVRIATWAEKDANDLLMQGRGREIASTLFAARVVKPDNIVTISDIIDKVLTKPEFGIAYPWESLTNITYGYQPGEIHVIVGANGIGKTEYVKELMFHFLSLDMNIGLVSFEQNPDESVRRIVGSKLGIKLHLPGSTWNEEDIRKEAMRLQDKLWLFDRAGSATVEEIFLAMRYEARAKKVSLFIVDNLKGLKLMDGERASDFMTKLQTLTRELGITVILLSHVSKDKIGKQAYVSTSPKNYDAYTSMNSDDVQTMIMKPGMEWETGRMPTKENIEGHSVIADLADYVFALSRNAHSPDPSESRTTKVKVLKSRRDSQFSGKIFKLFYTDEGKLVEENGLDSYQNIMSSGNNNSYL